ncbi:MAG: cytidine deaminase [Lachnospiraceae bacterium]|nr:cytidine deaminase [Lachnospiraceae bacterium]
MTKEELVKVAYEAQKFSYSPYSGFQVGAALLTKGGKVYTGCNIENAAFSPTNCAERTAFFKAVSEGEKQFEAIAIVGNKAGSPKEQWEFCTPCGVCRQVMLEFVDPENFVIYAGKGNEIRCFTLKELLPESFSPSMVSE